MLYRCEAYVKKYMNELIEIGLNQEAANIIERMKHVQITLVSGANGLL